MTKYTQIEDLSEDLNPEKVWLNNFKHERKCKEHYRSLYAKYYLIANKQHKQIEEMANYMRNYTDNDLLYNQFCNENCINENNGQLCNKCIIKHFENKVKSE